MSGKLRSKFLKWTLVVCVVSCLAAWWGFQSSGRVEPAMVMIPAGDFQMGNQSMPLAVSSDEFPVHQVRVSAFLMGNCEVTKAEWDEVREWGIAHGFTDLPKGGGKAPDHPVQDVSWYDVVKWCNGRSMKEGLKPCYTVVTGIYQTGKDDAVACDWSANGYRLPTEAEWEKAARGGLVGNDYPWGNSISQGCANYQEDTKPSRLNELWNQLLDRALPGRSRSGRASGYHPAYKKGDGPYTSTIASFSANGFGLHDTAGNVFEWCWDRFGDYPAGPQTDTRGSTSSLYRVARGGGWFSNAYSCRVAYRTRCEPAFSYNGMGFRLARSSVPPAGSGERSDEPE